MIKRWHLVGLVVLALILAACAPKSAPVSAPSIAAPQAVVPVPAPAGPTRSSEDVAWQKVLEAAKKEGILTVYTASYTIPLEMQQAFQSATGIRLEVISGRGVEFQERLKTEKRMGRMVADVIDNAGTQMETVKDILANSTDLPVFRERDVWNQEPWTLDPEKKYFAYQILYLGPYINTKLVSTDDEAKLKSWRDFLDPKWKGKMVVQDPRLGTMAAYFNVHLKKGLLDEAFMLALGRQQLQFALNKGDVAKAVAIGDAPIALIAATSDTPAYIAQGLPVKMLDMKEGVWRGGAAVGRVEKSPHPNAAKVFLNWLFTTQGMTELSKATLLQPMRKGVVDLRPEPLKAPVKNALDIDAEAIKWINAAVSEKTVISWLMPK